MLFPITKAISELLDPQQRESKANDLVYDDFEKMHPDDVARFCEWLTEKVDGYSSKIKLEAKDIEEEVLSHLTSSMQALLIHSRERNKRASSTSIALLIPLKDTQ